MNNYHLAPAQVLRASVVAPATSMVHELYPHQVQTQDEAEAQADKLAGAADAFEVVNGRLVQVRDPFSGLPLPGGS